jgi:NIMA-interacting peptidyl-prolyl cis-trans isomerase 1
MGGCLSAKIAPQFSCTVKGSTISYRGSLTIGCTVTIGGLTKSAQLNGQKAIVVRKVNLDAEDGLLIEAYEVELCATGERKKLRSTNLGCSACNLGSSHSRADHDVANANKRAKINGKPPAPLDAADVEMVRCSHLLVKHSGSRRPASWKSRDVIITRTKEEAVEILLRLKAQIVDESGSDKKKLRSCFAALAKAHSDCSSAKEGGNLSFFPRGQMQRPFEDAAFATEVDELTGVVDTESGVHILLRTA